MTLREANQRLIEQLRKNYDEGEAVRIAEMVIENITGANRMAIIKGSNEIIGAAKIELLEKYTTELLANKPVQYVLNEAWFAEMKFYVDENVLIPRPETEELVAWIVDDAKKMAKKNISILDIGTGSGCIAIAIKKKLPDATVHAIDISEGALKVAERNARSNNVEVGFERRNILDEYDLVRLPGVDIIVSNPPYIPLREKAAMHSNVVNFEPHIALYVPDTDPLIFYRAIARLAEGKSTKKIYFEIHQLMGFALRDAFENTFLKTELRKDLSGNDRFLCLSKKIS